MKVFTNLGPNSIKYFHKLQKFSNIISLFLFIISIIIIILLSQQQFNHHLHIHENALLVQSTRVLFRNEYSLTTQKLNQDLNKSTIQHNLQNAENLEWVHDYIIAYFKSLQFETAQQKFNVCLSSYNCTPGLNTYGVMYSNRSENLEALIVHVNLNNDVIFNYHELPTDVIIWMSLALLFSGQNFWSKDIIFLMTSHGALGVQAWVQEVAGAGSTQICKSRQLPLYPSKIIGILSLEMDRPEFSSIEVKIEGVNGVLPNLDLVSMVNVYSNNLKIRTQFNKLRKLTPQESLHNMFKMAWNQATGLPNGYHGPFLHYGLQGLTISAVKSRSVKSQKFGYNYFAYISESFLRSLNNLQEELHASYYLYLLPGDNRLVPIGLYATPLALLLLPTLFKAVILWLLYFYPWLSYTNNDAIHLTPKDFALKLLDAQTLPYAKLYTYLIGCFIPGVALSYLPSLAFSQSSSMAEFNQIGVAILIALISTFYTFGWHFIKIPDKENPFFHSALLILYTLLMGTLAMLNFSMALLYTVILTLPMLFPKFTKYVFVEVITITAILYSLGVRHFAVTAGVELVKGYYFGACAYGSWSYMFLCLVALPLIIFNLLL